MRFFRRRRRHAALKALITRAFQRALPHEDAPLVMGMNCDKDWKSMPSVDEERGIRYCRSCRQDVYSFVGKSEDEIVAVIRERGGSTCGMIMVHSKGFGVLGSCQTMMRMGHISIDNV